MKLRERGGHRTDFRVERFDEDQVRWTARRSGILEPTAREFSALGVHPYSVTEDHDCNLITDSGWNLLMKNVAGSAGTLFSVTVGRIGVGNGTSAVAYTDTDLSAASGGTNRQFNLITQAPTVGASHSAGLSFTTSFAAGVANFAWQEFGVDQGTANGTTVTAVLLNHGLSSQGTKLNTQVWIAIVTITWT